MTVRVKILILSAVLLLLFAVVLASPPIMQRHSSDKVAAIIEFQLPLAAAISDLDVSTSDYELFLERMLRRTHDTPAGAESEQQAPRADEGPHHWRLRARGKPCSTGLSSIRAPRAPTGSSWPGCSARSRI